MAAIIGHQYLISTLVPGIADVLPETPNTGPRSLPCSLVGFWRWKTAALLYKFPVQPPDLLYFGLTFSAKIPIFRCGGQKFRFWTLSQPFAPSTRIFQRLLSLSARFWVYIINLTLAL
jgi:hypothetical protein